ncbi:MAG: hypothetical protein QOE72_1184 [Chloroflexota bacterium]|jgi:hypothetical protein|nr:hypothetical protein [Chloroflexota bacterium]
MASSAVVRVGEITCERGPDDPLPLHLVGGEGTVAIQLRTTLHRVGMGAGLAHRPALVDAVRALPGLPGLSLGSSGGTFTVGGPGWLGLAAMGVPPAPQRMRLDWMTDALQAWLEAALGPLGLRLERGRVEGAWCPGFSDVSVGGRKLVGLGFRVTRDWIAMRGVMPVRPIEPADHELLAACHRLIGLEVRGDASTSLVQSTGDVRWTVEGAIEYLRRIRVDPG